MAKFHFVEDYENLVNNLVAELPIDEAMSQAVGGNYVVIGDIEAAILREAGLDDGMSVFDLGCGSGRLATALDRSQAQIDYLGADIVQALLDYADSKTPSNYRFSLNREISIPSENNSVDIACAFSVFTHLLHHETYLYLQEMHRVLKPGGRIVFSFLEFATGPHWAVFQATVKDQVEYGYVGHLNMFIERSAIEVWCGHLGFKVERYIEGGESIGGQPALGQSVAILLKN